MVTATDDINARLAAVEADIRNINTQLVEINANQRQMRAENQALHQESRAENLAMHQEARSEHQADIRQLHARIDRVFWAIIGFGSAIFLTMLGIFGTMLTLLLRIT